MVQTTIIPAFTALLLSASMLVAQRPAAQPARTPTAATAPATGAPPASFDPRVSEIAHAASPTRIEADIRRLAGFGTRNTFSDTLSATRGIGAARRWLKEELDRISKECGGCLQVYYQSHIEPQAGQSPRAVNVVNVIAVQRGSVHPNRYIIMSGDIDSRASSTWDDTTDAPGANDNGSGVAGVLEAARVLSKHRFNSSVVYALLSGEEQGLWGGRNMAQQAKGEGWEIMGVINNDMIGNIEGITGVVDNTTFRVFSEPTPVGTDEAERRQHRFYGGEVDGVSRQLARYIHRITDLYLPGMSAMMIYRLDRFVRGGHHRPFNDEGFPAVRLMETHEHYVRQHQDIRVENGIRYGDVVEGVNFPYAAKLTRVNAATMAALAWAPPPPRNATLSGAVSASTTLQWEQVPDASLAGYRVYWRETTAPQWQWSRFVGVTDRHTLENIVIDNYLFGVAAVGRDGNESVVVFPTPALRRQP